MWFAIDRLPVAEAILFNTFILFVFSVKLRERWSLCRLKYLMVEINGENRLLTLLVDWLQTVKSPIIVVAVLPHLKAT